MQLEETKTRSLLGIRGLRNKGLMVVSQDPRTEDYVLVAARNIRRKYLIFNLPEKMWKGRGSKEDVLTEAKRLLDETLLSD